MNPDLNRISPLNLGDAVKINGLLLIVTAEEGDYNLNEGWFDYWFSTSWDKKKQLFPIPTHRVRMYSESEIIKNEDGSETQRFTEYTRGTIKDLSTGNEHEITSIDFLPGRKLLQDMRRLLGV